MTKKDLEQFLSISDEIKQLKEQELLLKQQKTSIKSQIITDLPRGGEAKLLEDILIGIEEVQLKIAKKRARLALQILDIEEGMENLESNERRLIRYKYVQGMSYTKMEIKMGYSARHLRRMHAQILEKIA